MQVWAFLRFRSNVINGLNAFILRSEICLINTPLCILFRLDVLEMLKSRTKQSSPIIWCSFISVPFMFGFIISRFYKKRT